VANKAETVCASFHDNPIAAVVHKHMTPATHLTQIKLKLLDLTSLLYHKKLASRHNLAIECQFCLVL
jgi:hypothetical protein